MRIFLSWSGELSKAVATALKDWLPMIVSPAEPWMSEHDIQAGAVWENELTDNLGTTDCGVLVLTRENQNAPWLLFEAGILSKSADRKKVIPYRVDLTLAEVAAPLTRFQGVDADFGGTKKLVSALISASNQSVPSEHLDILFDVYWPRLDPALSMARATPSTAGRARRSHEDYFDEILGLLRSSTSPRSSEESRGASPSLAINAIRSEIDSLEKKISSMEEYERKGGGASSEAWWDAYVDRHRHAQSLYLKALAMVEQAAKTPLTA